MINYPSHPWVTTVDKFQGQQNDFILLSLVRTRFVGHLRDPTFQLLLQRPDHLALNLNEITSYTERHVEDTGPIHLVSGVEEMISIFNWRYQERYMSHQFDHYMTYSGQNDQQNSTTLFNAMDTDTPSVQHESSMEEDTRIDGDVLPSSHSNGEVDKEASKNDENDRQPESNSSEENMTEQCS
nr:intron-binding protein aquarius [Quercus suber]